MNSILIIAGEQSGESCGAGLIREYLRLQPETQFFGIGGAGMAGSGADLIFTLQDLSLVGIFEILSRIPRLLGMLRRLRREARLRRPAAAVLIDSPDFNLPLARRLKRLGIPILYYVSPTVWAWRRSRLRVIRRVVDRMLLIFPFEKKIYSKAGIPAVYVGHPLLERIPAHIDGSAARRKHGFDPVRPLLVCMPGSRPSEIGRHMPILMPAVRRLIQTRGAECALILADSLEEATVTERIPTDLIPAVRIIRKGKLDVLAAADLALSACGTANLEASLLGTPVVAFYKISPLTFTLGIRLVRVSRYSIVNILAGRGLIPELIQNNFTSDNLVRAAERILDSKEARTEMLSGFMEIRRSLGERRASSESARQLQSLLLNQPAGDAT